MFRTYVRYGLLLLCAIGLSASCARLPRLEYTPRPPVDHVVPVFVFPVQGDQCKLSTYPVVRVRPRDTITWEVVELTKECGQEGQDLVIIGFDAARRCDLLDGLVAKGKGKTQRATVHAAPKYSLPRRCKYDIRYGKYELDPEIEIDKP